MSLPLVGPILRIGDEPNTDRVHADVLCLFEGGFDASEAMVEEAALPSDAMLFGEPTFECGDGFLHGNAECHQRMEMVGHDKGKTATQVTIGFPM